MKNIRNWNIFTYKIFISHVKLESRRMKYLIHMWTDSTFQAWNVGLPNMCFADEMEDGNLKINFMLHFMCEMVCEILAKDNQGHSFIE